MAKETPNEARLGKIKLGFLYVLIGGLVASALISVFAILIGEFNDVIRKALLTTFTFVIHSLLVLTIVSADKFNQLGKALLPTTILAAVMAHMFTTTFGIWEIWPADASWKAFLVYILLIGAAFLISATLKLRLAHSTTRTLVYTSIGLISLLTLVLIPWIVLGAEGLVDFYYRAVGALTILSATALSVSVIVRRIALAQKPSLASTVPEKGKNSSGMLAVLIIIGTIVSIFWLYGLLAFAVQSIQSTEPTYPHYNSDRYYDMRYR